MDMYIMFLSTLPRQNTITVVFILLLTDTCYSSEIYSSTAKLENAFGKLEKLINLLNDYIQQEEQQINSLQRFTETLKLLQSRYGDSNYVGDSARLFSFSHAFTSAWSRTDIDLKRHKSNGFLSDIRSLIEYMPSHEDKNGFVLGIVRLQTFYNISAAEFAAGEVYGLRLNQLSVLESYDIACQLFERQYYRLSLEWFQVASRKLSSCGQCNLVVHEMSPGNSYNLTQDKIERKIKTVNDMIRKSLAVVNNPGQYEYYGAEFQRNFEPTKRQEILCKDNTSYTMASPKIPTSLAKCHFLLNLPRFQPMKIEVISHNPALVIVYDILTHKEIEKIKTDSVNKLTRTKVADSKGNRKVFDGRVSQSVYLETDTQTTNTFHRRLEAFLNMKLETEQFLVSNYGPGGSFELHSDYLPSEKVIQSISPTKTNRLLTFMFYLSDVVGGTTVFPFLNLKIIPQKGSVAVLMNLNEDGSVDKSTRHAGCPVVVGDKWIMRRFQHIQCENIKQLNKYLMDPFRMSSLL